MRQARSLSENLHIIVRTRYVAEITELFELGADEGAPYDEHEVIECRIEALERMNGAVIQTPPPAQVAVPLVESLRLHVGNYRVAQQVRPLD